MNADAWRRVKDVCAGVLECSPDERAAYLAAACGDDANLRAEVESLLLAHARAGDFIETPAAAQLLQDDGELLDPNLGRTIGPHVIQEVIGRGGMGDVYLGVRVDREFDQRVAIKMIRRGMDSAQVVARFRHERQILASLDHPNIARLFDGGTTSDGLPYFVMEYVDGQPITSYADAHTLTIEQRLDLCLSVCRALQHAHDRQIVHRDLKPSNVMVTVGGQAKLLDFGIAKILNAEAGSGGTLTSVARPMTPDYASPEQVLGRAITPATDVYAVGLLLYELLTGHRAFRLASHTPEEVARVVCEIDPERPSTVVMQTDSDVRADGTLETLTPEDVSRTREGSPERLRAKLAGPIDAILLKALRKDPAQRYASVAALADDLERFLSSQPVDATRGAWRHGAVRWARRHRTMLAVTALLALGVMLATGSTFVLSRGGEVDARSAPAANPARRSVAVVGFRNLSGSADTAWLSTALAEMLTTELAGDGQLRVVSADRIARAMRDVGVTAIDEASSAALATLRRSLGADLLVLGSFVGTSGERGGPTSLRLDVRAQGDGDDPLAAAGAQGDATELFALVADAGRQLRVRLGLRESPAASTTAARAAFPTSVDATRFYAEGISRLRRLDSVGAREQLLRAQALESGNPLIHTALSSAWTALGYDGEAAASAKRALDAAGSLGREDRLVVEGRLHEAEHDWLKAADVYRTLWGFFSDNAEYGLRLAAVQTSGGRPRDALATLDAIRQLPGADHDPRIDIQEGEAASALSDYKREEAVVERARTAAQASGALGLLARAELLFGRNQFNQGRPDPAIAALERARSLFLEVGDRAGAASALNSLGTVIGDRDPVKSTRMYRESLTISEQIGDRRAMSTALNNLGIRFKDERRFDEAIRAHEQALAIRREIGDLNWTAVSLGNLGVVRFEQGRFTEAARLYQESLDLARTVGDRRQQVRAQHNLAIILRETGQLAEAQRAYEESIAVREELNDRRGGAIGRVELGTLMLARGALSDAKRVLDEALQLARETKLRPGEAMILYQLGEVARAAGDLREARRQHEQALALRRELQEPRTIIESEVALAGLRLEEGRPSDAEREARAVLAALGSDRAQAVRVPLQITIMRARLEARDVDAARTALATAKALSREVAERIDVASELTLAEAELRLATGRAREARSLLESMAPRLAGADMKLADLERRRLLLRIAVAERAANAPQLAAALERDATAIGALSMARASTPVSSR